jgi:Ca-activated chloride channel family protein
MKLARISVLIAFLLATIAVIIAGCGSATRSAGYSAIGMLAAPKSSKEATRAPAESLVTPGQTTPSREEELWIIAKDQAVQQPAVTNDDLPGSGALLARLPDQSALVPVPLKHTDVKADIAGYIASVNVTQQFHNPFSSKIEAIYVFPLPHNAAVNEFIMTIGPRKIRGIIREREEAQRLYQQAKAQGYVASLMTQERPNIFTQSVANIEPGKQIDIDIKYFHTLEYMDGWYEWHFPMAVGPRFNPPGSTDGVGAVPRGAHGASQQKTEIQYLKPTERSGSGISLSVNLKAGVVVEQIQSVNHRILSETGPGAVRAGEAIVRPAGSYLDDPNRENWTIRLASDDAIPNKDFILRYRVAGDRLKSAIVATRDDKGGFFTLMLYPPQSLNRLPRKPLELVYVLDCSGSMDGQPIAQAKAAIRAALTKMRPDDTFQIIKFSNDAQCMSDAPLAASPANIRKALAYLNQPYGGAGTMMMEGIRKALQPPADQSRLRFVCFLTDGFIGNESEILAAIHKDLGQSRIFSFGVGPSVNRYLLDHMAKLGHGAVAYLALNQKAEPVMDAFFDRISHPALTDITIDWGGMIATEIFPSNEGKLPDLFVGRPLILTGKFSGNGVAQIRLKGRIANEVEEIPLTLNLEAAGLANPALRPIWARNKIANLADRSAWDSNPTLAQDIKSLALDHGLMSPFTAFIAVDATRQTEGAYGTSVPVPVPVPEGVRYDTTVATPAPSPSPSTPGEVRDEGRR